MVPELHRRFQWISSLARGRGHDTSTALRRGHVYAHKDPDATAGANDALQPASERFCRLPRIHDEQHRSRSITNDGSGASVIAPSASAAYAASTTHSMPIKPVQRPASAMIYETGKDPRASARQPPYTSPAATGPGHHASSCVRLPVRGSSIVCPFLRNAFHVVNGSRRD